VRCVRARAGAHRSRHSRAARRERAVMRRCLVTLVAVVACHGAAPPQQPIPTPLAVPAPIARAESPRSYAALDTGSSRLTIFVATTRRAVQSERPADRYGPDDADSLQFAAVGVNVPSYRARGTGEHPAPGGAMNALSYRPDPQREFFVTLVIPVDSNRFVQRIAADLATTH